MTKINQGSHTPHNAALGKKHEARELDAQKKKTRLHAPQSEERRTPFASLLERAERGDAPQAGRAFHDAPRERLGAAPEPSQEEAVRGQEAEHISMDREVRLFDGELQRSDQEQLAGTTRLEDHRAVETRHTHHLSESEHAEQVRQEEILPSFEPPPVRAETSERSPTLSPRSGASSEEDAGAAAIEGLDAPQGVGAQAAPVQEGSEASAPRDVSAVAQLANELVEACMVGQDQRARKVMMLDVMVPGRGQVRVRLTRDGDGVNVRLRADNDGLRDMLKAHQGRLREQAREGGVVFKQIEVV